MRWNKTLDKTNAEVLPRGNRFGSVDYLERLPEAGRTKLIELRRRRDDATALARDASDRLRDMIAEKQGAELVIRQLRDEDVAARIGRQVTHEDHPSIVEAKAKLERLGRELPEAQDRSDARAHRRQELGALCDRLESYLAALPGDHALPAFDGEVKAKRGATVESVREEIARLHADLREVRAAPILAKDAKALAKAELQRLAAKGEVDVFPLVEQGAAAGIGWPQQRISAQLMGFALTDGQPMLQGHAHATVPDTLGLLAALFPAEVEAYLERKIAEAADDPHALSDAERAQRIEEIEAARLQAERTECALVEATAGAVLYRADSDPRAVLHLSSELPAPAGR